MSLRFQPRLLLLSFLGTLGVLALNLSVPSLLNFYHWADNFRRWRTYMEYIVRLHQTAGPFPRRPVTTFLIELLSRLTGLDFWWSFVITQGLLLTLCGYLLARLAGRLASERFTGPTLTAFFLSFTVLFSFVTPNDSYDEFSQYLFLLLALHALIDRTHWLLGICLFVGMLARETTAFLVPSLLFLDARMKGGHKAMRLVAFFVPIALYALYLSRFPSEGDPRRWEHFWQDNFPNPGRGMETLVSLALALGLPGILLLSAARATGEEKNWRRAFWIAFLINTPAVLFFAEARESRLFALPLLFLWPWAGRWLGELREQLKKGKFVLDRWQFGIGMVGTALMLEYYHPEYRHVLGYRIYAAMIPLFAMLALSFRGRSSPGSTSR